MKMSFIFKIATVVMISGGAFAASNPLEYSIEVAQQYAANSCDVSPCQSYGCKEITKDEMHPKFTCSGIVTTLMHGGYPVSGKFFCEIDFEQLRSGKYRLSNAVCE